MKDNWKKFLASQGATVDAHCGTSRVTRFSNTPVNVNDLILCDLSHYGLIRVHGEEAESFLQNQFCNDLRNVSESLSQLNGYCNPKGRLLAFFHLFQRNGSYYLRLPREILDPTLNRLRMFVLMTRVTLEDASEQLIHIGFSGPRADEHLQASVSDVPTEPNAVTHTADLSIIRVPGHLPRFEIYGSEAAVKKLWQQLAGPATPVGYRHWALLDIHAAIPDIVEKTREAFVPQMINLQAINALSFKKGCYPGQEIVARMHYLGKLKRRMFLAHIDGETVPTPDSPLFADGSESAQGVGKVVSAQPHPDGGVDLLAVIEISSAEQRQLRVGDTEGPLMILRELPYELE
ncbi:MAG: folate-binding protein YgfZ [Gammaproteobacteria bacterium]|nr:folate-binding protein YgfZ [Gammaproteobacteria bacterium]